MHTGVRHAPAISAGMWAEALEGRLMLTGTWSAVASPLPNGDGGQLALLLSNGKVIVHGGGISYPSQDLFHGQIDDVRIYGQALAKADIQAIFANSNLIGPLPALEAEYEFSERGGSRSVDSSGKHNTLTLLNGAGLANAARGPGAGNALTLNGLNQLASAADSRSLDPRDAITLSAWENAQDWNGNKRILQKSADDNQYRLLAEGGVLKFDLSGVGTITAPLPSVHRWHLLSGTWDGTTMRLYVDGVVVASSIAAGTLATTSDPLVIGAKNIAEANSLANWYRLVPDKTGSYATGDWRPIASMNAGRLFFASDIFNDGKAIVVGGEYSTDGAYTATAETYNPDTNTWTSVPSHPGGSFGDVPSEVLPDGDLLTGDIGDRGTNIYNPRTNA